MGESQEAGSHIHAQSRMCLSLGESCYAKAAALRILEIAVDGG